jgi:hypothetical protein
MLEVEGATLSAVSFFEPPPPPEPPEPEEFDEPEWYGPPRHVLGAAVPLRLMLVRTDELVIAIIEATAYPNGFEFKLVVRSKQRPSDPYESPFDLGHPAMWRHHGRMTETGELPPELFRFGIEFADGSKATTLGGHPFGEDAEREPKGPVLIERGGGGGNGNWDQSYWVWPLPPAGPLAFVCEWPAKGISLTRHEIDAKVIRTTAEQTEVLWEDPGGGRFSFGGGQFLIDTSRADSAESAEEPEQPEEEPR